MVQDKHKQFYAIEFVMFKTKDCLHSNPMQPNYAEEATPTGNSLSFYRL